MLAVKWCCGKVRRANLERSASVTESRSDMNSDGDGRSDGRTAWTLGAMEQRNLALEGYCQTKGCGHFYAFKVDDLIASAGPDYVVPEILPGIVCRECGGDLKFKLAMMPPED